MRLYRAWLESGLRAKKTGVECNKDKVKVTIGRNFM